MKLRYFKVTRITKKGRTGKMIGVIKATNRSKAVNKMAKMASMPKRVRVFPVRLIKKRRR